MIHVKLQENVGQASNPSRMADHSLKSASCKAVKYEGKSTDEER